tara:strand:- start:52 stop:432 length:381 start_codon:yes stop_codon:yes gene_type:complete
MNKLDDAYKSIGEVAKILDLVDEKNGSLKTHTIRFWEKEFKQIKPKIFSGNRRYYDSKLIELLKNIKYLLKEKGMTINGVKKVLDQEKPFQLDEISNNSITAEEKLVLKNKLENISKIVKSIKKLK